MITKKTIYKPITLLLIISVVIQIACIGTSSKNEMPTNNDNYLSIKIGKQVWTKENLNVSTFKNGDKIIEINSHDEWEKAGKDGIPAWCYFGTDMVDAKIVYKKLYNWHAVTDSRGLAPEGWHIPSENEWDDLVDFLGGNNEYTWAKLKNTEGWKLSNGTNESGFSAIPGGYRSTKNHFDYAGWGASFWSSTEKDKVSAVGYHIEGGKEVNEKERGFSVRCIKN